MKKFLVKIYAYKYGTEFEILAEDNVESIENSIVDKLGQKDIVWEKDGFTSKSKLWLTYEEVINDTRSRPLYTKEESRTGVVAAL